MGYSVSLKGISVIVDTVGIGENWECPFGHLLKKCYLRTNPNPVHLCSQ